MFFRLFHDYSGYLKPSVFDQYVKDSFSPVGLMIDYWESAVANTTQTDIHIKMINDTYTDWSGEVKLTLAGTNGAIVWSKKKTVTLKALGELTVSIPSTFNAAAGSYLLTAEVVYQGDPVQSIREFKID